MRWLCCVLVLACGGDLGVVSSGDASTGDQQSTSGPPADASSSITASSTDSTTAAEASTAADGSSSDDGSSGAPADCGNGIVEDGEECDGGQGCRSDCLLPCRVVAHGLVDGGEAEVLFLEDVEPTLDGASIAVGTRGWAGGDVAIAHIDADGTLLDLDILDHTGGTDAGVALTIADDGSRVVLVDSVDDGPALLRYDADGELVSTDPLDEASSGTGLAAVPGGGLVVSGMADIGAPGRRELWVARHDATGPLWTATWADAPLEEIWTPHAGHVAVAPSGRIFVVADRPSARGPFGVYDPVVVAFGPDGGAPLWTWSEWLRSTNLDLMPRDIVVDAQGRVAALFFVAHGTASNSHFQLRVFDPDGRPVRAFDSETLDHGGGEQAGALVADADGRLVVFARRVGIEAGEASGSTLVLGFDPQGEIVCDETLDETLGWIAGASRGAARDMLVVGSEFTSSSESDGTFARIRGF